MNICIWKFKLQGKVKVAWAGNQNTHTGITEAKQVAWSDKS